MKKSSKLLLVITMVIVAYLVVFDAGLKAEYLKGDFKKRFFGMDQLSFANFTNIKNNVSDIFSVRIEKGDKYQVWIESYIKDKVAITQHGKTLDINFIQKDKMYYGGYGNTITIICPQLDSLTTTHSRKDIVGELGGDENSQHNNINSVVGFKQSKMVIKVNKVTGLFLNDNQIDDLQATVGDKMIGNAYLSIGPENHIKQANLQVPGKSELKLLSPVIEKLNYTISENTKLTLTGNTVSFFKK